MRPVFQSVKHSLKLNNLRLGKRFKIMPLDFGCFTLRAFPSRLKFPISSFFLVSILTYYCLRNTLSPTPLSAYFNIQLCRSINVRTFACTNNKGYENNHYERNSQGNENIL